MQSISALRKNWQRHHGMSHANPSTSIMTSLLTLMLVCESAPLPAYAAALPMFTTGADYANMLGLDQRAVANPSDTDAEHVAIRFLPNAPADPAATLRGEMGTYTAVLDNTPYRLPENKYVVDGYTFVGWSTVADMQAGGTSPAPLLLEDKQQLTNLDYDVETTSTEIDENGNEQPITRIQPHSLAQHMTGNSLSLYAQWSKNGARSDDMPTATISKVRDVEALIVENADNHTQDELVAAIEQDTNATRLVATQRAASLETSQTIKRNAPKPGDMPSAGDGSNVTEVGLVWVTPDTIDNGNDSLLYLKPGNDLPQSVVMRLNYALSGEFDYEPDTVHITIPATMFCNRDGNEVGRMTIPYPENPKTSDDFNWTLVSPPGEEPYYLLTNTRKMSAATKGYIEFMIDQLVPHKMKDMGTSEEFWAHVEIVTHRNNVIGLTSDTITAQIDTEERVRSANKYNTSVQWVTADEIPSALRQGNESEYVVVSWYMYSYLSGNTEFTLSSVDTKTDDYNGFLLYPQPVSVTTSYTNSNVYSGYTSGNSDGSAGVTLGYQTVRYAYPASQFEPDTTYTFKNRVTYTLTERDEAIEDDPQLVTEATANASVPWSWHMPEFNQPTGHFMVNKIGNDGATGKNSAPYWAHPYRSYYSPTLDTNVHNRDDYYGVYPTALNDMQDGNDLEVAYTVESIGYILPWTCEGDYRILENYGKKSVHMVTYDTDDTLSSPMWLNGNVPMTLGTDYDYKAVEFPKIPSIGLARAINLNPDGSIAFMHAEDGTVDYAPDYQVSHIPVITLEAKVNGAWVNIATANWSSGSLVLTSLSGNLVIGNRVLLPSGTQQIRTTVDSKNAYIWYYIRPIFTVHRNGRLGQMLDALFAASHTPEVQLYNSTYMKAFDSTNTEIVDIHKNAMDKLQGYSTDVAVTPTKDVEQGYADVDYDNRCVTLHYTAKVQERSFIPEKVTYQQALDDRRLIPEEEGVWYDLLPKGVEPLVSTVRLRNGDSVRDAYAIRNYKDSGRTLLIVEASMTPVPKTYDDGGVYRYMDVPEIHFDATYPFEAIKDYGKNLHNVIAFESLSRDPIGNVTNHGGEPDDPYSSNNTTTAVAFLNNTERDIMQGLDSRHSGNRFVYAGVSRNIDALSAARTSLSKDLNVSNDEKGWSKGTYDDKRTVYEGGWYSYRLRMMSDANTTSKDLVLYDALESFYAGDGNDDVDINAPRWNGSLVSVDMGQLTNKGIAPVLYYSTSTAMADLMQRTHNDPAQMQDSNGNPVPEMNITNPSFWVPASSYTGDLAAVKAIAIDCRKTTEGTDFELQALDSLAVFVYMHAPSGSVAREAIQQQGVWGDSAHAYNNIYLRATSIDNRTQMASETNFIRNDYTKVGLKEHNLEVTKEWNDDDNRDGLRPASITVRLYANKQDTGKTVTLSDANEWHDIFQNLPFTDEEGQEIRYTLQEDVPTGYTASMTRNEDVVTIRNTHGPERTTISGTKTWVNGDGLLPSSVTVNLLADGVFSKRVTVRPDADGNWKYSFDNLFKYHDGGQTINYTVQEQPTNHKWLSSVNGYDITNTYHPYGDLRFDKKVIGQTSAFADTRFTFRLELRDGTTDEFLTDEYAYQTSDGRHGTIGNGGTIALGKDESVLVSEIPDGAKYEIIEQVPDGYHITYSSGLSGSIVGNSTVEGTVTNTYSASGSVSLGATKHLSGRDLARYQFRAEVYDSEGALLRTATNNVTSSDTGVFTFGAIRYTEANAGQSYTYTIRETIRSLSGYTYDDTAYKAHVTVTDNGDGTMTVATTYTNADDSPIQTSVPTFNNEYHASGSIQLKAWKQLKGRNLADGEFTFKLVDENGTQVGNLVTNDENGTIVFDAIPFNETHVGNTYRYIATEVTGGDTTVNYDSQAYRYEVTVVDNGDGTLSFAQNANGLQQETVTYGTATSAERQSNAFLYKNGTQMNVYLPPSLLGDWLSGLGGETGVTDHNNSRRNTTKLAEVLTEALHAEFTTSDFFYREYRASGQQSRSYWWFDFTSSGKEKMEAVAEKVGFEGPYSGPGDPTFPLSGFDIVDVKYSINGIYVTTTWYFNQSGTNYYYTEAGAIPTSAVMVDGIRYTVDQSNITPVFTNTLKPGSLKVEKHVVEVPAGHEADEFKFHVQLTGENLPETMEYEHTQLASAGGTILAGNSISYQDDNVLNILNVLYEKLTGLFKPTIAYANIVDWTTYTTNNSSIEWMIDDDGGLVIRPMSGNEGVLKYVPYSPPWYSKKASITSFSIPNGKTINVLNSTKELFSSCKVLTSIDLTGLNTQNVTNMDSMFSGCSALTSLDLTGLNTQNVTDMSHMFSSCVSLASLTLTGLNTQNVTDMSYMFSKCRALTSFDVASFNTGKVKNMSYMFSMDREFFDEIVCACTTPPDTSQWNTENVTNMTYMFQNNTAMTSGPNMTHWDTHKVTNMAGMFYGCYNMTTIDVAGLDTENVTNMSNMFCLDYDKTGTRLLHNMKAQTINVSGLNTSSLRWATQMFRGCSSLTTLDVSNFDMSNVTNISAMFCGCSQISVLDVSRWNTANVIDMSNLFDGCLALPELDLHGWNTANVQNMCSMFARCKALQSLDLSGFNTNQLTNMNDMFAFCNNLEYLDLSSWDTSHVQSMNSNKQYAGNYWIDYHDALFRDCRRLSRIKLGARNALQGVDDTVLGILPTPPTATTTGKWINAGTDITPHTSAELAAMGPLLSAAERGEWIWEEPLFTLVFDANGGSGSMANATSPISEAVQIPASTFMWFGHIQTGWTDGQGHAYNLGATIPPQTYNVGDIITLTAQWADEDTTVTLVDGAFEVTLKANEAATFHDCLPAGTTYQVYEETPSGWVLVSQSDTSGNIRPTETSTASFTNRYDEGHTSVSLTATKLLDSTAAETGAFGFELRAGDGTLIESINNTTGGGIAFSPIVYGEGDVGVHEYQIAEIAGNDDDLTYDSHIEHITVTVTKSGLNLTASVTYDDDGAIFKNETKPGSLQITKQTTGGGNPNQEFEFEVTLKNTQMSTPSRRSTNTQEQGIFDQILNGLASLFMPKTAYAASYYQQYPYVDGSTPLGYRYAEWCVSDGVLTIRPSNGSGVAVIKAYPGSDSTSPWYEERDTIQKVVIEDTVYVTDASQLFKSLRNCTEFDLHGLNTTYATSLRSLFEFCSSLQSFVFPALTTINVQDMSRMFGDCSALQSLDVSNLNTSNVTNMGGMFDGCSSLTTLDISNFDVHKVEHAGNLFRNGTNLTNIEMPNMQWASLTSVGAMFSGCTSLTSIDISHLDTSKVYQFTYMFNNCSSLRSLDVSTMDVSHMYYCPNMFNNCSSLVALDLSTWDLRMLCEEGYEAATAVLGDDINHAYAKGMFTGCSSLETIYASPNTELYDHQFSQSSWGDGLFTGCVSLIGGHGTSYDPAATGRAYARIDGGPASPGYFSFKGTGPYTIAYDAAGGAGSMANGRSNPDEAYRIPESPFAKLGYHIAGWTDNFGHTYAVRDTIPAGTYSEGRQVTLTAVWEADSAAIPYHITLRGESGTQPGTMSTLAHETHWATAAGTVTITPNDIPGYVTPASKTVTIAANGSTEVTFDYMRRHFNVTLDGNGYTTTSEQAFVSGVRQALQAAPTIEGMTFVGWTDTADGSSGSYNDRQEVAFDSATTLYAQYVTSTGYAREGLDTTLRVKVKAGETVTIPNIPAGTEYEIREINIPSGWTQTGTVGGTGTIAANAIASATITNTYATEGTFDLVAYKHLQGKEPVDGEFSFELVAPNGTVIQTVANDDVDTRETLPDSDTGEPVANPHYGQAPIAFRNITSPAPGTYTYKIREVRGNDTQVTYDTHEENITVQIIDNQNGTSHAVITYDNDGPIFNNEMKDGNLQLSKTIEDETPASKDATFTFDLELVDSEGTPIPDASCELVRQVAPTLAGVTGEGMTLTSNFVAEEGHVVVTYDANGGYYEGGYAKNLIGYEVTPTGVTPVDGEGEYADPLSPASDRSFGGWYLDADCTDGQEFQQSSLTANQPNQTVYAKWNETPEADQSTTLTQFTDGHATITISGGEKVWINGLPIGTTYTLTEQPSAGWTPENPSGLTGTIQASTTAAASVTNRYEATGSFPVSATKIVTGIEMEDGAFSFILTDDDDEFVARANNDGEGHVTFAAINIDPAWAGTTRQFHLAEERGDIAGVQYDTHTEDISVAFADDGAGTLTADVTYDDGTCEFHNSRSLFMPITGMTGLDDNQLLNALAAIAIAGMAILCGKRKQQIDEIRRKVINDSNNFKAVPRLVLPRRETGVKHKGWHE